MRTLCVKAIIKLFLVFMLCLCLDYTNGRTIDSTIARASRQSLYKSAGDMPEGALLTELDMLLTREQYNALHSKQNTVIKTPAPQKLEASRIRYTRWPNKRVPYRIQPNVFSEADRGNIMRAIDDWEKYTCITFPPATSDDLNVVYFTDGFGCLSKVGMTGGQQSVILGIGCLGTNVIIHEIGHAISLIHEHNRADRDDHVIINLENLEDGSLRYFRKNDLSDGTRFGVPYDYTSIMHYGGTFFSSNGNKTIVTKDPAFQEVIGTQDRLSFNDIKLSNLMYNCSEQCRSSRRCPKEGFLGKDCRCWCPGNPVKECEGNIATESPSVQSTLKPTERPTRPTEKPTTRPTEKPTTRPTERSTTTRTEKPTTMQTEKQTTTPTEKPTTTPTEKPTTTSTEKPTTTRREGTTTRPTVKPTLRPTPTAKCRDMDPDCVLLATVGYCQNNYYAKTHCKASCSLCEGDIVTKRPPVKLTRKPTQGPTTRPTKRPTATTTCTDVDWLCPYWATVGYCNHDNYVNTRCKASCFLCEGDIVTKRPPVKRTRKPTPSPTTRPTKRPTATTTCTDVDRLCPYWATVGYCNHDHYVSTHCKASCFLCEGDIVTKRPPVKLTRKPTPEPTTRPTKHPTPTDTCMDMHSDCPTAAKSGYCHGNYYVQTYCKASCSLC